jgi:orotate phosphoribosyltransferase
MTDEEVLKVLQDTQAIRKGHFQLTSGRHSDTYIQCARILEYPRLTKKLAEEAVARLPQELRASIDLVISPAIGGILWGFAIADVMDRPLIFTERKDGEMQLRRSFEVPQGSHVLIAEDVVTTGGSVKEVEDIVCAAGGDPQAVVSIIDRGGKPVFNTAFYPLLQLITPSWAPEACELCKLGTALDSPGSRRNQ